MRAIALMSGIIVAASLGGSSMPAAFFHQEAARAVETPAVDFVASIKRVDPRKPPEPFLIGFRPTGQFLGREVTLGMLISYLYGSGTPFRLLPAMQVTGGPKWMAVDRFIIEANPDPDLPAAGPTPSPAMLSMLRTLLTDRFKLQVHTESRETPIYALVMLRSDRRPGPRLRPTASDCAAWISGGRRGSPPPAAAGERPCGRELVSASAILGSSMPLSRLATRLSPGAGRFIEDRTGLTGTFDVDLQWTPEPRPQASPDPQRPSFLPPVDPNGASLFTALQEQLGLKLEAIKGSVPIVVVDHAEPPTEN